MSQLSGAVLIIFRELDQIMKHKVSGRAEVGVLKRFILEFPK